MMSFIKSCCLLLALLSATMSVYGEFVEQVARVSGTAGRSVYIPVNRKHIQSYLDSFQGPKLYLPEGPIFDDQPEGTHPILIDVSHIVFEDFQESEAANPDDEPVSTEGAEVTISIPYLAESQEGPTSFSLGIMLFYGGRRGVIPESDFIYPYLGVDKVMLKNGELDVRMSGGAIRIDFDTVEKCDEEEEEEEDEEENLLLSFRGGLGADEHFCLDYPYENQFCSKLEDIEKGMQANAPNVCIEWNSENEKYCETSANIIEISGFFKYIIGYDEGTQPVYVEQYQGDYDIGAKFPCV